VGEGWAWALTCDERCSEDDGRRSVGRVLRLDPISGEVQASIAVQRPHAIAAGEGGVWVIGFWDDTVIRIDLATDRVTAAIKLSLPYEVAPGDRAFVPSYVTVGEGAVWVATGRGAVARIDPERNEVAAMIELPREAVTGGIAVGEGGVWLAGNVLGVHRIDPATNRVVATIPVNRGEEAALAVDEVTVGGGAVWAEGVWATRSVYETGHDEYESTEESAIVRIEPTTGRAGEVVPKGPELNLLGFDGAAIWLGGTRALLRVDPGTARVTGMLRAGERERFVDVQAGSAWIARPDGTVGVVRLSTTIACRQVEGDYDPSLAPASGPPGSTAVISGPLPMYGEGGAIHGSPDTIEVWWNADPELFWKVDSANPSPFAPGPVVSLARQDVRGRCTFEARFRVPDAPDAPQGKYIVLVLQTFGEGSAAVGHQLFEVTG